MNRKCSEATYIPLFQGEIVVSMANVKNGGVILSTSLCRIFYCSLNEDKTFSVKLVEIDE